MKFILRFYISIFLILSVSDTYGQANPEYDVVIVGAGASGLAAAYNLNDKKVLILEKQGRIGGRVNTRKFEDVVYELGAYSAYPETSVPFEYKPSRLIRELDSLNIYINQKIHKCMVPLECMYKVGFSVAEINNLQEYDSKNGIDFSLYSGWKIKVMNSFFNIVQGGDIRQYAPKRQRDAFKTWTTDHYANGNSELIYEMRSQITGKVKLGAEVKNVSDKGTFVELQYQKDGKDFTVTAKSALITTPAPITKYLIYNLDPAVYSMLDNIKFNSHSVYIVVTKNDKLPNFNYTLTPEFYTSTIIKSETTNSNLKVYYFHFADKKAAQFEQFSETRKAKEIRTIMDKLWGSRFDESIITHEDYKFWKMAAAVADKGYYERMGRSIFNPSKRIFLAGDYLDLYGFPLGIHAALKSGQLGGNEILKFLSVE